jgi:hypothetical protein
VIYLDLKYVLIVNRRQLFIRAADLAEVFHALEEVAA